MKAYVRMHKRFCCQSPNILRDVTPYHRQVNRIPEIFMQKQLIHLLSYYEDMENCNGGLVFCATRYNIIQVHTRCIPQHIIQYTSVQ
jgi:hypothetical protein